MNKSIQFCISSVLCILLFTFLSGCQYQSPKQKNEEKPKPENIQQDKFTTFLKQKHNAYERAGNDIAKSEFVSKYEKDLVDLSDSLGIIKNWKAVVEDIIVFDWTSYDAKEITVELKINLSQYYDLIFFCKKMYSNKDINSSLVYRQLKTLRKGQTVYFDGILSKNKDNKIDFYTFFSGNTEPDNGTITRPYINLNLISISRSKQSINNSEKINKILTAQLDVWKSMNDYSKKKISQKVLQRKFKSIAKEIKPLTDSLSKEEKDYIQSVTTCLGDQFQDRLN